MAYDLLPPGQRERAGFRRFGLPRFAKALPDPRRFWPLALGGDAARSASIGPAELAALPRVEQVCDFHCVTTWSSRGVRWGGYRFRDFYERLLAPAIGPDPAVRLVVFRGLDGFAASLPLDDALAPDALLADTLEGEPLGLAHGAPLRFVAPRHYGYKSAKHLRAIEVWTDARHYRFPSFQIMDHPRARVDQEERGRWLPGWAFRWPYRLVVPRTFRMMERALKRAEDTQQIPAAAPGR